MASQAQANQPANGEQRGLFITLEGVDGAGKSTHVQWLAERIAEYGVPVLTTREPGGTPLGEQLRELLLHHDMHIGTEALLVFAARNEHLQTRITPALEAGTWVVCDRFTDASYAYQGGGRQLGEQRIAVLEEWVRPHVQPDFTFLFDVPLEVAWQRVHGGRNPDRFEQEEGAFFERTRKAYLERARQHPERFCIIDATRPIADTRATLLEQLARLTGEIPSGPAS